MPYQVTLTLFIGKGLIGLGLGALYVPVLLAAAEVDPSLNALALDLTFTVSGFSHPLISLLEGQLLPLGRRMA